MFLIPFIYKKNESFYTVHKFYIFLNNGTLFLQMDSNDIDEFCKINELYYSKKIIKDNYCYLEINENTNLKNFYSYTENSNVECWRNFILIGSVEEDSLHINNTNPEFILNVLKEILNFY
jgi:hypothetical protein